MKAKNFTKNVLVYALVGLLGYVGNSYSIELSQCQGSRGNWVRSAIDNAQNLDKALNAIREIKQCNALGSAISSLRSVTPLSSKSAKDQSKFMGELANSDDLNGITEVTKNMDGSI